MSDTLVAATIVLFHVGWFVGALGLITRRERLMFICGGVWLVTVAVGLAALACGS